MVAIIQSAEEGGFYAYCPSLPGCASQGETYAQTVENITEAIQGMLEVLAEESPRTDFGSIVNNNLILNVPVKMPEKYLCA